MRTTIRLLLSRIGQQRQPYSPVALRSASYVRFYTSHNPSEEQHEVWNVLKNCLSWIKSKQGVRIIVPEAEAYVIERDGNYVKTLTSGIHSLGSTHNKVAHVYSLKEETISIPHWPTITTDNVAISIDGSLCVKIVDPMLASYGTKEPVYNVIQLAQTTMEVEIKQMTLDETFEKRDTLNELILMRICEFAKNWGFECLRYEMRDISFLGVWKETMEELAIIRYQSRAESLASKVKVQTMMNIADANKSSRILAAKAQSDVFNLGAHVVEEKFMRFQNVTEIKNRFE